jgi:phosphate starvation-inducible membrane PsiE
MFTSIDSRHSDTTAPHPEVPASVAAVGIPIGIWVRIGLILIVAAMTLIATVIGVLDIARAGRVTISDVLLMFIYLEIWAMIVIEATTRRLPVNFIIFIAITVLTRHLVGVAGDKSSSDIGLLIDAGSILVLALAAVLLNLRLTAPSSEPASEPRATP